MSPVSFQACMPPDSKHAAVPVRQPACPTFTGSGNSGQAGSLEFPGISTSPLPGSRVVDLYQQALDLLFGRRRIEADGGLTRLNVGDHALHTLQVCDLGRDGVHAV